MTGLAVRWRTDRRETVAAIAARLAGLAFAVLIVSSPMGARFNLAGSRLILPYTYVVMLVVLGLWVVSVACRPRRLDLGPAFIWAPVAGLLAVSIAGIPGSVDPTIAAWNVFRLSVVVALGAYVVNEVDGLERLAVPIMLMIGVEAVVGIGQAALQHSVGLTWLDEVRNQVDTIGAPVVGAADGSRWLRAYGLSTHPNILGGIIAFALLLLAAAQGDERRVRIVRLGVFALGVVVLFLTFSRAAWIAFAIGLVIAIGMLALRGDRAGVRRWASAALLALGVGVVLAVPFSAQLAARALVSGPVATETRSIDERMAQAGLTLEVIAAHPLLGTGLGTLTLVLPSTDSEFVYAYLPAHVVVLDAAAETGVVGFACYLVLIVAPWVALARVRRRWTRFLAGASAALAAVTVVGLFDFYTWAATAGRTWAWIVLGLWVVAYRAALSQDPPGNEP